MKLTYKQLWYVLLMMFVVLVILIQKRNYFIIFPTLLVVVALIYSENRYPTHYWKSYFLLLLIGVLTIPKIILIALIWIIPGTIIFSSLSKDNNCPDKLFGGFILTILLMIGLILLSYLGIPVSRLVLGIIFCLPLLLLIEDNTRHSFLSIFNKEIDHKRGCTIIAILIITCFVYGSFFQTALPQTTAVEYYSSGKYVESSILNQMQFPTWEIKNTLGQARYTLDTPLFFWLSGISGTILGKNLSYIYNSLFIFITFFLVMILYFGLYYLTNRNSLALLGTSLFIGAEQISRAVGASGNMKAFASFVLMIVPFYFFLRFRETKNLFYLFFIILGAEISLLTHIAPIHFLTTISIVTLIVLTKDFREYTSKKLWMTVGSLFLLLIFISFWVLPFISYFYNTISEIDAQLQINLFTYLKDNILIWVTGFISFLGVSYFVYKKKEKLELLFLGIIPLLFIIPYVYKSKLLERIFSLFKIVEFPKTEVVFFLSIVILLMLLLKNLLNEEKKIFKKVGMVIIFCAFIFASFSIYHSHQAFKNSVSEQIHTGTIFSKEFNFVKQLPPGNVFTAGVFGLAIDGIFYDLTNHSVLGTGFAGAQENYLQYRIRMDDGYTIYNNTREYITNMFKLTGIKYLFINRCNPGVELLLNELFSETFLQNKNDPKYNIIFAPQNQCIIIFELNESVFAKPIKLAQLNFTLSEKEDFECIRVTHGRCLKNPKFDRQLYNRIDGSEIIWTEESGDYFLNKIDQNIPPASKENIDYHRLADQKIILTGKMAKEWIYLAESYFPRWKAYDNNGKELEIRKTNLGTIIIKVEEPITVIQLVYAFPFWEKTLYFISLLSIIGIFIKLRFSNKM